MRLAERTRWNSLVFILLVTLAGCSNRARQLPPPAVKIFPGVSATHRQAVLHLAVYTPDDGNQYGSRSLASPVGSSRGSDGHFQEERLVAIQESGFQVLLTRSFRKAVQTVIIDFSYGKHTEVNALGCKVVGEFE